MVEEDDVRSPDGGSQRGPADTKRIRERQTRLPRSIINEEVRVAFVSQKTTCRTPPLSVTVNGK